MIIPQLYFSELNIHSAKITKIIENNTYEYNLFHCCRVIDGKKNYHLLGSKIKDKCAFES